jgi:hypothetical protein
MLLKKNLKYRIKLLDISIINIQAIDDNVIVNNVVINRGNCSLSSGKKKDIRGTVKLKFGKSYTGYSPNCKVSDIKEIKVYYC